MAYTEDQIAVLVGRRMGAEAPARLRYIPLVDAALRRLAVHVAARPLLRHWLLTDQAVTTATLDANGVCDLSALIASPRILLETLQYGRIYHATSLYPLQWNNSPSQGALGSMFDPLFLHCWLEGVRLYTRSIDGNATPLTGDLSLSVPYWPTLAQLPNALVEMLVEKVIEELAENKAEYNAEAA